jgi:hypothetical protein
MQTLGKVLLGWVLSAGVVALPYVALRYGVPWLIETQLDIGAGVDVKDLAFRWELLVYRHYWWVLIVYLLAAGIITPRYDREEMGLFGTFVDNPFSYQDDYNRAMFGVMVVLTPGKIVWLTLHTTFVEIRDRLPW